jgi:hypothetical protein
MAAEVSRHYADRRASVTLKDVLLTMCSDMDTMNA